MITSFTSAVVAELAPHVPPLACCRAALFEGMLLAGGEDAGDGSTAVVTTRAVAARAALGALHADARAARAERLRRARRPCYRVAAAPGGARAGEGTCCARSRLRGAFLVGGAVARPDAAPQLDIGCRDAAAAERLVASAAMLGVHAVAAARGGRARLAVRSAGDVASLLSSIGAQTGRLRFEEGRVVREMRAEVNRRLNSETANLRRTALAGVRQLEAVRSLRADRPRWEALPEALREAGALRQAHPEDSLDALAVRAGCSRSAMADRLRRLLAASGAADRTAAESALAAVRQRAGRSPGAQC